MTERDDLAELHALAASIAEQTDGWRDRRRRRAEAVSIARAEAELVAPIRRRRRHRVVAGLCVGVLAAGAGTAIVWNRPARPAPEKHRSATAHQAPATPAVQLGRQAALSISRQGRVPDAFACLGWFDHQQATLSNQPVGFRNDYLAACADATVSGAEER